MTPLERFLDNNEIFDLLNDGADADAAEQIEQLTDDDLGRISDLTETISEIIADTLAHRAEMIGRKRK